MNATDKTELTATIWAGNKFGTWLIKWNWATQEDAICDTLDEAFELIHFVTGARLCVGDNMTDRKQQEISDRSRQYVKRVTTRPEIHSEMTARFLDMEREQQPAAPKRLTLAEMDKRRYLRDDVVGYLKAMDDQALEAFAGRFNFMFQPGIDHRLDVIEELVYMFVPETADAVLVSRKAGELVFEDPDWLKAQREHRVFISQGARAMRTRDCKWFRIKRSGEVVGQLTVYGYYLCKFGETEAMVSARYVSDPLFVK